MKTGGWHDVEGEYFQELSHFEGEQDIEFLLNGLIASDLVDDDARAKLQLLLTAFKSGVRVAVSFEAIASIKVPYTLDASSNRQHFRKIGSMYFLSYEGMLQGTDKKDLLPIAPGGTPEAIFTWCCLAAL